MNGDLKYETGPKQYVNVSNQWLPERHQNLPTKDVKEVRRGGQIADDPIYLKKLSIHHLFGGFSLWSTWFRSRNGSSTSVYTDHRIVTVAPNNDPSQTIFPNNRIISKKYTLWTFIPKNLFEQFRRIANFYFLVTAIMAMSIESPISPLTSSLPLTFVILVTACKQGYEDYLRHRLDQRVNRRSVTVVRNKCMQDIHCEQIVVGDLVKVSRDEDVPCDLILLFSTEETGRCYVTTSNLDGETNLKTLLVPKVVSDLTAAQIVSMEATVTCQHPLSDLYAFHGNIEINREEEPLKGHLTIQNLLLRGSRLKDTEYVIGCAVYTGQDTKLSLNSKIRSSKFSTAEKSINKYLVLFIILLTIEVVVSTMWKIIMDTESTWRTYLGSSKPITFYALLTDILSFAILYNYIVPISLYVTIELQKFLGSFFFVWDIDMFDKTTDQPAMTNTSDLNEELGQVEYLFTDKTGTLTENLMVFRRCSINGKTYMEKDCDGILYTLPPSGNEKEAVKLSNWQSDIWHFMISISLCHVVQIAPPSQRPSIIARRSEFRESFRLKKISKVNSSLLMHPDLPEYQVKIATSTAASADEKALVEASARCGVIFQRNSNDEMEIKINENILIFKKLEVLEFTSERKRMSIIVKDTAGDYWLYCKGADSAVLPLIVKGKINETIEHVADFSMRGFRTLVVGYKKMNELEYKRLIQNVEQARQIIGIERGIYMERAYNMMESELTLLGVTAVEDRLQEGVQETLECLRVAGIKVWVLTGDKAETAENIAFLCGHFKQGTEILRMTGETDHQSCLLRLTGFERRMKLEPHKQYGLIMDGPSIVMTLTNSPELLRSVGMACEAVVCCRLTPLQKSEIVHLIKCAKGQPHTAAIGDGGNDVSMIQEAHVGIGMMGKEGRQATMSADFAIAKFKFLKKALLVHGHWYYVRISVLTQYFFYKNLMFITPQFIFGIHSGFSTQELYDSIFLMCYNVLFTSLPVLAYGLFEQDHSAETLLRYPYLYKLNRKNYLLSGKQFIVWIFVSIWHTSTVYFMTFLYIYINPINLYDNTPMDHWAYSTCIFHMVTLVANMKILLCSSYWTVPFVLTVAVSEVLFFIFAYCYSSININYDGDMFYVFHKLLLSPTFWLLTVVIVVSCLIPDYIILTYNAYRPARIMRKNEEPMEETVNSTGSTNDNVVSQMEGRRFEDIIPWRGNFSLQKTD